MTDRILSAEKVKAWIAKEAYTGFSYIEHDIDDYVDERELLQAIDSGQLDADRPECPKCGDTGETIVGEHARWTDRCDCPAAKQTKRG